MRRFLLAAAQLPCDHRDGDWRSAFAVAVEFDDFALAFEADEVVAVGRLARATELVVQLDVLW